MNKQEVKKIVEQTIKNINDQIETMQSETRDDYILMFDNGGAVAFNEANTPHFTQLAYAETVATKQTPEEAFAYIPNVFNGAKEPAKLWSRKAAIQQQLPILIETKNDLVNKLNEFITA